jgi:hypothetical protein
MSENCETEVYDNYTDLGKCGGDRGQLRLRGTTITGTVENHVEKMGME